MTPQFLAACKFSVAREEDGKQFLRASICIGDRCFDHEIALDPILNQIKTMIADYHRDALHGGDQISGYEIGAWYNSAASSAKRVASSKAAHVVFDQVREHQKTIATAAATAALGPAGGMAVQLAYRTHDVVVKARQGDRDAKAKIVALARLADEGDPTAELALKMARGINQKLEANSQDNVSGWADKVFNPVRHLKYSAKLAKNITQRSARATKAFVKAPSRDSGDTGDEDEETDTQSAGWFYNRGYRSPTQYMMEIQKSPGTGLTFRELYSLGNGNSATTRDGLVLSALRGHPTLSKVYSNPSVRRLAGEIRKRL